VNTEVKEEVKQEEVEKETDKEESKGNKAEVRKPHGTFNKQLERIREKREEMARIKEEREKAKQRLIKKKK